MKDELVMMKNEKSCIFHYLNLCMTISGEDRENSKSI